MPKQHLVIYTTVIDRPCVLYDPILPLPEIDKICYTNLLFQSQSSFQIVKINPNHIHSKKRYKYVKICWPEIFDKYEYSLYIDSTVQLKFDPTKFIDFLKPNSDILLFLHPGRNCLYDEALICLKEHLGDPNDIRKQTDKYHIEGFPEHYGLWACGIMLRKHTEKMRDFAQIWWSEVEHFCIRDQISFPYIAWKLKIPISIFPIGTLNKNPYIHWYGHRKQPIRFTR